MEVKTSDVIIPFHPQYLPKHVSLILQGGGCQRGGCRCLRTLHFSLLRSTSLWLIDVLTGKNVRLAILCNECSKPRGIYSKRAPNLREMRELHRLTRKYEYVCGCLITSDVSFPSGEVFTRLELTCSALVEFQYHAARILTRAGCCCQCRGDNGVIDKDLKETHRTVLPLSIKCKAKGKTTMKRGPITVREKK